jgi:acyl-CoA thioesterase I
VFAAAAKASERSILVLGDSLSAAYGIAESLGWVVLLREQLRRERLDYIVVNVSVSGETTAGGLARVGEALAKHRPAIVVVELGGNDGLRGLPVRQIRANLSAIVMQSQDAGARVLLVGMKMPPNYGPDYTGSFEKMFGEVAKRYRTALVPFFLQGIAGERDLMQPDGIHPTEKAQPLMMQRIRKGLAPLLK